MKGKCRIKGVSVILLALLCCWLSACGSQREPVAEERIVSDIYEKNRDLRETGLEVTDYEITARQTDDEGNTDTVWVAYTAENSEAVYFGEVVLYYEYWDDVWSLSNWDRGNNSYTAKYDCDPSVPLTYLQERYTANETSIYVTEQTSWAENQCTITCEAVGQENPVCSWVDGWTLECEYNLWNGWQVVEADGKKIQEVWDICGTYTCNNANISATVALSSFALDIPNNRWTATLSYSLTSYLDHGDIWGGPVMQQGTTYSSAEPVTVEGSIGYDNEYVVIRIGNYAELYLCGRYVSWDPIGEGLGIWIKVLGNYSQTYGEYWLYQQ